jgi:arginine decarboxylase
VLVFEVVDTVRFADGSEPEVPEEDANRVLLELYETYQNILPKNVQEAFHDAQQGKEEAESLFKFGYLSLRERAQAERLFWACCDRILRCAHGLKRMPEELNKLEDDLAAIYYCNFSVFQSAPDAWAIDQLFPIMPIHRLEEEPTERAVLVDLTCDSDGKIARFIDYEDTKEALEVHELKKGDSYRLALFLNGAYQEILGDLHNLFGDTNAVHVRLDDEGFPVVRSVVKGDSVSEVLSYVEHKPHSMIERVRRQAERARRKGLITPEQVRLLMRHYEEAMQSYTYLSNE